MKTLLCLLVAIGMILAMAACGDELKKPYEAAVAAYNAGDYAAASEMLQDLGGYLDAAQILDTIKAEKTGVTIEEAGAEGTVTTNVEYTFKDGNLIKETITHADGTVTKNYYKYDKNGLCTSETLNQIDGSKVVINHLYEDGIKVRSIRTNADKSKDTFVYTCDENGNVTSHMMTLADGTVEEAVYNYDKTTGMLVSIITADTSCTFTYNRYGDVYNETHTEGGAEVCTVTYNYSYNYFVD